MKKLRIRFDNEMEKQHEINQNLTERLETLSERYRRLADYQNNSISQKFLAFDERIRRLEGINIETNAPHQSKLKKMKEISKKFATTTTFYGITRAVKAESPQMKIAWAWMTLISLSYGLYIIDNTINEYRKNAVFTQTKRMYPEFNLLPSVSFCTDARDLSSLINQALFNEKNGSTNLIGQEFYEEKLLYGNNSNYHCLIFNNHKNNSGQRPFYSKTSTHDILVFNISLNAEFTYLNVFLSDNYLNVLDWSNYVTGFGNKATGKFYIDFTKSIEHKLEEPFNDCQIIGDETYRQANCIAQCKNKKAIAIYNCTCRNYYSTPGFDFCDHPITEFDSACREQCPQECTSTKFEAITNSYEFTNSPNDSLLVSIAYTDFSYLEISQTAKTTSSTVMSNIGGTLGLFIGIRFLSMVELIEYLIEIFFVFY